MKKFSITFTAVLLFVSSLALTAAAQTVNPQDGNLDNEKVARTASNGQTAILGNSDACRKTGACFKNAHVKGGLVNPPEYSAMMPSDGGPVDSNGNKIQE